MEKLIQFFYDYFINEKNDGYLLLCSSVCLKICNGLYDKFILDSIKPIEMIDEDLKKKYWEQAIRFYQHKPTRIKAMITAYTLEQITGKND